MSKSFQILVASLALWLSLFTLGAQQSDPIVKLDPDGKTLYITLHNALYRIRLNIEGVHP